MEKSMFFNARETQPGVYDRVYQAEEFAAYFAKFIGNGVFPNPSTGLQVVQNSTPDMTTVLSAGSAYINGYTYINDAPLVFIHKVADGTLNRKDAIFIRFDKAGRAIAAYKMESSLSADPVAPSIIRTSDYYDLCVGVINIKAGITKITQDLIEDTRMNKSVCGIVTGVVDQVDTTTLYNQIQSDLKYFKDVSQKEFDEWFADINAKLGTEPATNLQNQVNKLNDAIGGLELEMSNNTNEVSISAAENRVGNVSVDGFTKQSGSGDASPSNVREIQNAGICNKRITIDQNNKTLFLFGEGSIVGSSRCAGVTICDIPGIVTSITLGNVFCQSLPRYTGTYLYYNDVYGISIEKHDNLQQISFRIPGCMTLDDYKARLKDDPLDVIYQSTENTGECYTGIEITQGDEYRCEIIELKDRLHAGDTLETNVQSEYDAYAEFDGSSDENWLLDSGSTAGADGSKRMWIKLTGPQTENTSDKAVPVAASNQLTAQSAETTYIAKAANCFDVVYSGATNMLHVRIDGISTAEALKTYLQTHKLKIWYKSTSGSTGKNVRHETHMKKQYVFTGTENIQKIELSNNSFYVNFADIAQNGSVGSVICNQAKAFAEADIASSRIWGVSGSSNNPKTFRISSPETTVDAVKTKFAEQYSAGTPFIIEYELAQPEVFADEPIEIKNPRGTFKVSSEVNSVITVGVKPDPDIPTLEELGAEPAFDKNTAFNKNFGKAAGTVCEGNDTRLSDARRSSNITMSRSGTTLNITYS